MPDTSPTLREDMDKFVADYDSKYPAWASRAYPSNMQDPSDKRIVQGWTVEQPRHTYFNWHMRRTDFRLNDLEARTEWLFTQLESALAKIKQLEQAGA